MADATATQVPGRRRIIERPRLTRLLDESPARIKMLVAPAGYGKTTLARQWLQQPGQRGVWIQCTPAASDVAVLLAHLAEAANQFLRDEDSRALERLRVTAEPAREIPMLVDLIAEDLREWPSDAWLVLDDYHALMSSAEAEELVENLVSRTSINLTITSRRRPTWITPRQVCYGEILEVGTAALAMNAIEAREMLGERPREPDDILAAADGWPAFIALAALNIDIDVPRFDTGGTLYNFLANEIYSSVAEEFQHALREVALAPRNHAWLLRQLHPPNKAVEIHAEAVRVGIFSFGADGQPELHPLLQQFLLERCLDTSTEKVDRAVARLWDVLTGDRMWDDAFSVLARARRPQHLPQLLNRALDHLLEAGRSMSLRKWIEFAIANEIDAPIVKLAEAELALRSGMLVRAEAIATDAVSGFATVPDRAAQCWCVAGQAAHLQSNEVVAIEYFRRAGKIADAAALKQTARWGELSSSVDLELESAERVMHEVVANESRDAAGIVRRSNAQLIYEIRFGGLESLREAELAKQVVDHVKDPVRRAGFWSVYATGLAVAAYYETALDAAASLLEDARNYRVDFALPYGHAIIAMGALGLRRYTDAADAVAMAAAAAARTVDAHALANASAIHARLLLSQGRYEEALVCLDAPLVGAMTRGMIGELLACRALAQACLRDPAYSKLAAKALAETRTLETRVLVPVAHAIFKSLTNAPGLARAARLAVDSAAALQSWDCFVCGYRAHPEFLLPLRADSDRLALLTRIATRTGAGDVFETIGLARATRERALSPREAEVHSLLALGLTNREIAGRLFISEATVKLHVHRVLGKLDARTRTAAAAHYRLSRDEQQS